MAPMTTTEDTLTIKTNNVPRPVVEAYELTPAEREEFDYIAWADIDAGLESASFFRYKGQVYDLGEFGTTVTLPAFSALGKWDGYISDTFFSGVVVRFVDECERVVVGTFFS